MRERQIVEVKSSFFSQVRSRKAEEGDSSIKQPKSSLQFGRPSIIGYSQENITVPRPVRYCRQFLQNPFKLILLFSLRKKKKTRLTVRHRTTLVVFHEIRLTEVVYALQVSTFRALEARGTHIFTIFPPFCSKKKKKAVYD